MSEESSGDVQDVLSCGSGGSGENGSKENSGGNSGGRGGGISRGNSGGSNSGEEVRLGFVVSEFHRDITHHMEILGREHAAFLNAKVVRTFYVPGVFDMPLAVKRLLELRNSDGSDAVDAVVTLGCVIEGATEHDEIVAQHAARKIIDLSLEYGKPVTLGISGPGMTRQEAMERIDYAKRAVEAAVKMVRRLREL